MVPVPTKAKDLKNLSMVLSNVQAEADRDLMRDALALKDKVETGKLASKEADRALKRDALALKDKVATGWLASAEADRRNAFAIAVVHIVGILVGAFHLSKVGYSFGTSGSFASFGSSGMHEIAEVLNRYLDRLEGS